MVAGIQGRSEVTSSVAFEELIINCQIDFINLFIFNCLTSNINLFIFSCLTSNFSFSENHIFCKQKIIVVYGRASLVSDCKFTGENDDLLSSRHKSIFKKIRKCGFLMKGIKLTGSVLFVVLLVPQL